MSETLDLWTRHPRPWRLVPRTNVVVDANGLHVATLVTTTANLEAIFALLAATTPTPDEVGPAVRPRHLRPHAEFGDDPSGHCGCAGCDPRDDCGCTSCRAPRDD